MRCRRGKDRAFNQRAIVADDDGSFARLRCAVIGRIQFAGNDIEAHLFGAAFDGRIFFRSQEAGYVFNDEDAGTRFLNDVHKGLPKLAP